MHPRLALSVLKAVQEEPAQRRPPGTSIRRRARRQAHSASVDIGTSITPSQPRDRTGEAFRAVCPCSRPVQLAARLLPGPPSRGHAVAFPDGPEPNPCFRGAAAAAVAAAAVADMPRLRPNPWKTTIMMQDPRKLDKQSSPAVGRRKGRGPATARGGRGIPGVLVGIISCRQEVVLT